MSPPVSILAPVASVVGPLADTVREALAFPESNAAGRVACLVLLAGLAGVIASMIVLVTDDLARMRANVIARARITARLTSRWHA